jgi:predicted dehydrogenase
MTGHRPLKIGVVGLGFGVDVHVPGFRCLPDVGVVALLGKNRERASDAERRSGISATTCFKRFFDRELDAVSVAVPPAEVEAIVNLCLERNLSVLCEKPLGPDLATAKRLLERSDAVTTAVDFEFAELETFAALYELIHSGGIGGIRHMQINWLNESWMHRSGKWSWKTDAGRHGGVLNLFGTHVLYLAELLLGPITSLSARLDSSVTAGLRPSLNLRAAEELAHAIFEHDSGAVTAMTVGNANPGLASHRWTVVGTTGTAVLENTTKDYMGGFTLLARRADGEVLLEKSETKGEGDGRLMPFTKLAARFVAAVRAGDRCVPGFLHGARVQLLIDAIRLAAQERRLIKISEVA